MRAVVIMVTLIELGGAARHRSKAEMDWDKTQKATDDLIAKVNAEMKTLGTDLDRTTKQDRKDLALLEQSRQTED
ncbi:hypothetical protein Pmar_PMAR007990, partial [Perkinsus marinus ATCC 50983]